MTGDNEVRPSVLVAEGPVLLELHPDGVAHIRLNRPDASNGLDITLLKALHEVVMQVHGDGRVRAVLLTGEGRNFCAGGDVHTFLSKGAALPDYIRVATSYLQIVASLLMRLNAPVVAAVHGFAAGGGGLGLVCSSDLVVAGESARFLAGATRVAMVPDAGVSVTLTQLVGLRKAMEILMLNPVISAAQALEMGLINRVVPDDQLGDEALALTRQLAAGAPAALAGTKRLLWSGLGLGVEACMPEENRTQAQLAGMSDALEGLAAVIEKRAPRFLGR
ncbi:enoyl-CoA hydratase-related protein [Paraburkholderia sp. USG1]|uniref:enoyl-CoA hydratase/isomerase family protein n=1 Tax=Paraburkholderia sp. USG1 TaxID=2952268 RepID=UPI0028552A5E|nr:enoyl-CoA hydratase-related protein [Paraburkholderia sp. USG1]MDR8394731.1 enoyl-CoA hydratase-related protein [Paraburkholderia sp. USG1]